MARLSNLRTRVQAVSKPRFATLVPNSWHVVGATAASRGYGAEWERARAAFLRMHPLCQCPDCDEGKKRVMVARVVDHIVPHRGDQTLFWDRDNWQAMSIPCHNRKSPHEAVGITGEHRKE